MDSWHIDKGIDISLIITVVGCAVTVIVAVMRGWIHFHDRAKDLEAGQEMFRQEIATIKSLHDRDREGLTRAFGDFTTRIEAAINRLYDKLDGKADKP